MAIRVAAPRQRGLASTHARDVDDRLWGGFSIPAQQILRELHAQASAPAAERVGAAWGLARWYASESKPTLALEMIRSMHALAGARILSMMVVLLESKCLVDLGRHSAARQVVHRAINAHGTFDPDLCLAYANCLPPKPSTDKLRLDWINRTFLAAGLAPIAKARPNEPLTFENLTTAITPAARREGGPKVSIIVPVFNAAGTIGTAIEALLRQTWANKEIIVVDDASTDASFEVLSALAAAHGEIRLLRQEKNQGVYAARNHALEAATGELITVHDSDDWSHPQKIETQVGEFLARPQISGVRSFWVRTTSELCFANIWRGRERLLEPNYSSFMFRRDVGQKLGAWDRVRAGADREFIERAKAIFGQGAFVDIRSDVPLAFGRVSNTSITQSDGTAMSSVIFGARKDYNTAAAWWQRTAGDQEQLKLDPGSFDRRFPAPWTFLPKRAERPVYDLLVVGDSNATNDAFSRTMDYVHSQMAAGKRAAFFHWPSFDYAAATHDSIWQMAQERDLAVVAAGEKVRVNTVLIADPAIMEHQIDSPPVVEFDTLAVNGVRASWRSATQSKIDAVLLATFGDMGSWDVDTRDAAPVDRRVHSWSRSSGRRQLLTFDAARLETQKKGWESGDPLMIRIVADLLAAAEAACARGRLSVVDKAAMPTSGDAHDYLSVAPYWWPDPDSPDGVPYILKDGERSPAAELYHPESQRYDRSRAQYLFDDVTVLALAWYFTGNSRFAEKAQELIATWFIDPATRMNPHLRFAQVRLGHNEDLGTRWGVIEFKDLYYMLDAIRLLAGGHVLDQSVDAQMKDWLARYLIWLLKSANGKREQNARNNHGILYDLQVLAVAHHLGESGEIERTLERARARIGGHFQPDGRQPLELTRTKPHHYCVFNLQGWAYAAIAAETFGVDLWNEKSANAGGLEVGFHWLLSWAQRKQAGDEAEKFDEARLAPLREIYARAYPQADLSLTGERPPAAAIPNAFDPLDGIRPFWRLGQRLPT